jgi:hypothetical protein
MADHKDHSATGRWQRKHHLAHRLARRRLDRTRATARRKSPKANRPGRCAGKCRKWLSPAEEGPQSCQNGPIFRCHRQKCQQPCWHFCLSALSLLIIGRKRLWPRTQALRSGISPHQAGPRWCRTFFSRWPDIPLSRAVPTSLLVRVALISRQFPSDRG